MKKLTLETLAVLSVFWLICIVSPAYSAADRDSELEPEDISRLVNIVHDRYPVSTQFIFVSGHEASGLDARLFFFEKQKAAWRQVLGPVKAVTGRFGIASPDFKREGDGKTPQGIYPLGIVFGYAAAIDSAMPYRRMTRDDIWVDDPRSTDYNHLTKRGMTDALSYEPMVLPDNRYKYGIVIEYNTNPVIPDHGSAIFLHVWQDAKTPTAGCIAISEDNILKLLSRLDPAANPVIILETASKDRNPLPL